MSNNTVDHNEKKSKGLGPEEKKQKKGSWRNWFIYIVLVVLIILFTILNKNFFSISNFRNIARQVAMVSIIGFGMTFIITSANIDLSVGSVVALVSVMSAFCLQWGLGVILSSIVGIATGMLVGFINGIIVTKVKIPSFLVTLGMLGIARGTALTITGTKAVTIYSKTFKVVWGSGNLAGIPIALIWVVVMLVVMLGLYSYTIFGNHVKATGGNSVAARFSGINTDRVVIKSFLIVGFCTAIAGLIMTSRIGTGRPEIGSGMELDVIAAVILGGTSLFGGKGSIITTLVGALIMTIITNGLIILGVEYSVQMIIKGIIIIAAVSLTEKSS
jgi:ribose transport system permease protein